MDGRRPTLYFTSGDIGSGVPHNVVSLSCEVAMHAAEIRIHNFRSVCDATIRLSPYGLLVGANNAGKSTVIDAIRAFYGKGVKFEANRDFPKKGALDRESWIEIEFRPTAAEIESLKDEYKSPEGTFRVRSYLSSEQLDSEKKLKTGPYAYVDGQLSDSRFYGFKNVGQSKFGTIIYIPAVSKIDEHTKLTGPSALRDLVNAVLNSVMESSDAYKTLHKSFHAFEGSIKTESTPEGFSLQSIEADISKELVDWGVNFRLTVTPVGVDDIIKGLIGHEIGDPSLGASQPVAAYGQGFQRSVIYSLIRVAARYTSKVDKPTKKDFAPDLNWILFEEPEAFLHPTQISVLSSTLRELASAPSVQVLLSTHSPQFASHHVEQLPAICRLRRDDCRTAAFQITESDLSAILTSNQADAQAWQAAGMKVHPDDLLVDMEGIKYALWLDSRRCGAFFAERVLLVEGPTEAALLTYLHDLGKLPACRGVFLFDTIGKFNIHRFMKLFGGLGIRHYVLYDGDGGNHAQVVASIEASRNGHTGGISSFPVDIETFLGLPSAGQPHRKPQHVMHKVASGAVAEASLDSLAEMISTLLAN